MYEQIDKGDVRTWVRKDLKGRQKEHCMCWNCRKFMPETDHKGCSIIREVLKLASINNIVLPVWECAVFDERK